MSFCKKHISYVRNLVSADATIPDDTLGTFIEDVMWFHNSETPGDAFFFDEENKPNWPKIYKAYIERKELPVLNELEKYDGKYTIGMRGTQVTGYETGDHSTVAVLKVENMTEDDGEQFTFVRRDPRADWTAPVPMYLIENRNYGTRGFCMACHSAG